MRSRLTRSAHALSQYAGRVTSGARPPICTGTATSVSTDARDLRTTSPSCSVSASKACSWPASSAGNSPLPLGPFAARERDALSDVGSTGPAAPFDTRFAAVLRGAVRTPALTDADADLPAAFAALSARARLTADAVLV